MSQVKTFTEQHYGFFKLPRKLKKQLKTGLMRRIDKAWKPREVRVLAYRIRNGRKEASSYSLG
jgi:hypothetical protein